MGKQLTFNLAELVKYYPGGVAEAKFIADTGFTGDFYPTLNSPLVERRRITNGSLVLPQGKIQLFDPNNQLPYYGTATSLGTGIVNIKQSPINQVPTKQIWALQGLAIDPRFNANVHGLSYAEFTDILNVLYGSNIAIDFHLGNDSNRPIVNCFLEQIGSISAVEGYAAMVVTTAGATSSPTVVQAINTLRLANKVPPSFVEPKVMIRQDTFDLSITHVDTALTLTTEVYLDATILRQWWMAV